MKKIIYIQKYHNSSIVHYDNGERKYVNELPYKLIKTLKRENITNKHNYKIPILVKNSLLQPTASIYSKNCEFLNLILIRDVCVFKYNLLLKYEYINVNVDMSAKTFYKLQKLNYLICIRLKHYGY